MVNKADFARTGKIPLDAKQLHVSLLFFRTYL